MRISLKDIFCIVAPLVLLGCGKEPNINPNPTPGPGGGGTVFNGTVASFEKIPLPTVDIAAGIIPVLSDFYVTNKGPYIQIQDSKKQSWSVYKYHGQSGNLWSSFKPTLKVRNFMPSNFANEKDLEFSIYWTEVGGEKYGLYNLNNGVTSFEYTTPLSPNGPGGFSSVIPAKKGFQRLWGILGNDIWVESAVAVPKKFTFVKEIQATGYLRLFFADPDQETELWCATQNRLYQVGSVGSGPGTAPGILNSWDLSTVSSSDVINAILKVDGKIIVQFGNRIYRQQGTSFNSIGTLGGPVGATASICTNGSTLFASDGTYYNFTTNTWKSFLGSGTNLNAADTQKFNELKTLFSSGFPIGVLQGSVGGPVFLLGLTDLVKVNPIL